MFYAPSSKTSCLQRVPCAVTDSTQTEAGPHLCNLPETPQVGEVANGQSVVLLDGKEVLWEVLKDLLLLLVLPTIGTHKHTAGHVSGGGGLGGPSAAKQTRTST
jgi:hypothetical protein